MTGVEWLDGITVDIAVGLATAGGPYAQWGIAAYGWDIGQWAVGTTWEDLSERLTSWSTSRKFRDDATWGGGTGRVVLTNQDGYLSGDNPSSPYVVGGLSSLQPWRPARIRIGYAGEVYDIATMVTGTWQDASPMPAPASGGAALVELPIKDEWARLALAPAPGVAATGAGDYFGPRLHRILDAAGHRGPRDIDVGRTTMQATTLTTAVLQELALTAASEGVLARVWVDAAGTVVARDGKCLIEDDRSCTVQATFTDEVDTGDTGDVPYITYRKTPAGTNMHTGAIYTRVGGTAQAYRDTSASALVGGGGLYTKRSDLVCESDDQVLASAKLRVALDSVASDAVTEVTVAPRAMSCARLATILSLRELDLVQHVRHAPGGYTVTRPCHIAGISHSWNVRGRWRVTFKLTDATVPYSYSDSLWNVGQWGSSSSDPTACKWVPG